MAAAIVVVARRVQEVLLRVQVVLDVHVVLAGAVAWLVQVVLLVHEVLRAAALREERGNEVTGCLREQGACCRFIFASARLVR